MKRGSAVLLLLVSTVIFTLSAAVANAGRIVKIGSFSEHQRTECSQALAAMVPGIGGIDYETGTDEFRTAVTELLEAIRVVNSLEDCSGYHIQISRPSAHQ